MLDHRGSSARGEATRAQIGLQFRADRLQARPDARLRRPTARRPYGTHSMIGILDTVGERLSIAAEHGSQELIVEGAAGELRAADRTSRASVHVRVESSIPRSTPRLRC
jgi:hypothetical protein